MNKPKLNPDLLKVPLYIAGKPTEEVQEAYQLDEVIKLGSNENLSGPSPKALKAAQELLGEAHRYPGAAAKKLRLKIAETLGSNLNEDNILIGNGGTDILRMITQAFIFDGGNTLMSQTTFPMYRILTTAYSGTPLQIPPLSNFHHDLSAIAQAVDEDTRVIFLCTPNNPIGNIITQSEVDDFMDRIPDHIVVVIDESYIDYVTDPNCLDSIKYINEGRNVFSVRSFSKSAGLANFRVGYLIGPPELTEYVRHTQLPFHTGAIALAAAAASLEDEEYIRFQQEAVIKGREYLYEKLCEIGLTCFPSQANHLTIHNPPIKTELLVEELLINGFIVRGMAAFGLPNGFRVAIGTQEQNEKFIQTMNKILKIKASL